MCLFLHQSFSVVRAFLCRPQFVCLSRESVLGHPSVFMWGRQGVGWSTRGMDLPVFGTVLLYMRPGEGANLDKHTPPKHSYFLHLRHSRKRWVLNWLYRFRAMWCTWFLVQIEQCCYLFFYILHFDFFLYLVFCILYLRTCFLVQIEKWMSSAKWYTHPPTTSQSAKAQQ